MDNQIQSIGNKLEMLQILIPVFKGESAIWLANEIIKFVDNQTELVHVNTLLSQPTNTMVSIRNMPEPHTPKRQPTRKLGNRTASRVPSTELLPDSIFTAPQRISRPRSSALRGLGRLRLRYWQTVGGIWRGRKSVYYSSGSIRASKARNR